MGRLPPPELPDWLKAQLPFDRYMVEVGDGLRMHVMEQGEGRPVLLFHGNPTWGYLYRKVAAQLTDEPLRLIMPDLIGLGFSDRPNSAADHTMLNHPRWMAGMLGQLDLEDAVVVVQDWGGPIGLHSVSQSPGLMTGLVVMNTSIDAPKPGFKGTKFHRVMGGPLGGFISKGLGFPQKRLRFAQGDRDSIRGVVQKSYSYPLTRARGNDAPRALVLMVPDGMDHESVGPLREVGDFVRAFEGPSAIVWGDRDPVLGRLRRRTERMLPDATVTATEAGHFLQEEVPAEIAAAIRDVVSRS
ncbi:MAG: alpha/beta fold hydrolase [Actinomycetota bacterium]|nr:alpha/beta fold hydrolase [Actinomycetota bacterium]